MALAIGDIMKIETKNGILKIEYEENKENKKNIYIKEFGFADYPEIKDDYSEIKDDHSEITDSSSCTCTDLNNNQFEKIEKNLNRFNTGQVAITMSTLDKPDIDQIADIDKDIQGYDRIRVHDSMERTADVTVINDGPDLLYFVVNRNGINHEEEMCEEETWSQKEIMLYPGEAWKIYNVYELRIRSETQGNKYRITEDDIIIGSTIRSVM